MNTIRSTWYGWGTLCVAGGGAYYFAKRQINADRADRYSKERLKQERLRRLEVVDGGHADNKPKATQKAQTNSYSDTHNSKGLDHKGQHSREVSEDAVPAGHAPEIAEQKGREKSKYEASEPYRSRKGDRFS